MATPEDLYIPVHSFPCHPWMRISQKKVHVTEYQYWRLEAMKHYLKCHQYWSLGYRKPTLAIRSNQQQQHQQQQALFA